MNNRMNWNRYKSRQGEIEPQKHRKIGFFWEEKRKRKWKTKEWIEKDKQIWFETKIEGVAYHMNQSKAYYIFKNKIFLRYFLLIEKTFSAIQRKKRI